MLQASLYSTAHALQARDAAAMLEEYPELLGGWPGEKVLDVGCGPGTITAQLLRPALTPARLVGVDICPDMVAHAREAYGQHDILFEQLDIAEEITPQKRNRLLQGDSEGFHKAFSFYCLHWVQDQRRAFENIKQLLRPGGKALLVFLASCPVFTAQEVMSMKSIWRPYMQDVQTFVSPYQYNPQPANTLQKLLTDIGFQVKHCKCRPSSFEYNSFKEMTDSLAAVNPFLRRIPEELKETFIHDCISESVKLMQQTNNGHWPLNSVQYQMLSAYVQKK